MPYWLINSNKPSCPIFDCLSLNIAERVPLGIGSLVSRMIVTRVRFPTTLVIDLPWLDFRPYNQPSFWSSLISFIPEMAGNSVYFFLGRCQLSDCLYARCNKSVAVRFYVNSLSFWSIFINLNTIFFKKSFAFTNILKCIKVKYDCFLQSFFGFIKCTSKIRRTKFITKTYPITIFFVELAGEDNIASHMILLLRRLAYPLEYFSPYIYYCQWQEGKNTCIPTSISYTG